MNGYAVDIQDLTRKFGAFTAVDNLSLTVNTGEIFGFLGANGAGKTTAIRMLCGLLEPTSGSGHVSGLDIVTQYEQIKRNIPNNPLSRRSGITEVEASYSAEQAREQGTRCLYCHINPIYDGTKCVRCNRCVDICPEFCLKFAPAAQLAEPERFENVAVAAEGELVAFLYDEAKCIRCGLCAIRCPTGAITMEKFYFDEEMTA